MFRVVIPARYASVRLPGKVLLMLAGKPMLQWVFERARGSGAAEVLIAADDQVIVNAAHSFRATTVLTASSHASGTDRIAEVARKRAWLPGDIVINVQADEPLLPPRLIDQVAGMLEADPDAQMSTLAAPITSIEEMLDPSVVKVVADEAGRALYFSRAPIPWDRDGASAGGQRSCPAARRHVGIYGYRVGSLIELSELAPGRLEQVERLEQLRALENGIGIRVADCIETPGPDVNTPADLERVIALLAP